MNAQRQVFRRYVLIMLMWIPITAGSIVADHYRHRARWIAATGHVVIFVTIAAVLVYGAMLLGSQKELERLVFIETTAIAFYLTMAAALVAATLFEIGVIGAPSPWTFWNVGWVSWCVVRLGVLRRKT